jgi:hypothetical protein
VRAPTVGVCGFGRCGSTMAMAVLAAGGVPTVAGADERSHEMPLDLVQALPPAALEGHAVKLLDAVLHPADTPLPTLAAWRFMWLDRDPHQQARSQVKLLRGIGVRVPTSAVDAIERSYVPDRPRALAALGALGPVHVDSYERALDDPAGFAARLAEFLHPDLPFDPAATAGVVHHRRARCAPTLEFERTGRQPRGAIR